MSGEYNIIPFSEKCALVQFDDRNIELANEKAIHLFNLLKTIPLKGFRESVPAYNSLAVLYEPDQTGFKDICGEIEKMMAMKVDNRSQGNIHEIHVQYGGKAGPDLLMVSEENGITPEELISLHTEREYHVYMVGFAGGFPYLGFTHEKLYTGRKSIPEQSVPAGSVALAGNQTGIYPFESPGAWKIIGHTDYIVFDPRAEDPAIIKPGDNIKFVKI